MSRLLCVVDYQVDFVSRALCSEAPRALEVPLAQRVKQALADGWQVLFTRDTHGAEYLTSREGRFLPLPHCLKNSEGWHLYGQLAEYEQTPLPDVAFLDKPTFGAEGLPAAARALCGGEPEAIEVCGVVTNICVVSNAIVLHSAFLNADITVRADLCAAGDPADHENALRLLKGMGYRIAEGSR